MKGHQPLLEMRTKGRHPPVVFIDTEPDRLKCWRDWHAVEGGKPTISVNPDESIERLDLRCIHGVTVSVQGSDEERVNAVGAACIRAGAKRVVGFVCASGQVAISDTGSAHG